MGMGPVQDAAARLFACGPLRQAKLAAPLQHVVRTQDHMMLLCRVRSRPMKGASLAITRLMESEN